MSDPSTPRMTNLLLATSSSAMSLASSSLYFAAPSPIDDPSLVGEFFKTMRRELDDLEAGICALMRYAGVSWDALAENYDVSRQALHQRLAARADEILAEAQTYPALNHSQFYFDLELVSNYANRMKASFDQDLSDVVEIWQERRKRAGWWRDNDS